MLLCVNYSRATPVERSALLLRYCNVLQHKGWCGTIQANTQEGQADVAPKTCPHGSLVFPYRNICLVGQVFLLKRYSSVSDGGKDGSTASTSVQENDRRALDACRNMLTRRGLESTGAVPCISPECGNWMVPEGGGQRVRCDSCLIEFCGR